MILRYSQKIHKHVILNGHKIHTVRKDVDGDFTPGVCLDHVYADRNFYESICTGIEPITIHKVNGTKHGFSVWVGHGTPKDRTWRLLDEEQTEYFLLHDFIDPEEVFKCFLKDGQTEYTGKIIHWTNYRYHPKNSKP